MGSGKEKKPRRIDSPYHVENDRTTVNWRGKEGSLGAAQGNCGGIVSTAEPPVGSRSWRHSLTARQCRMARESLLPRAKAHKLLVYVYCHELLINRYELSLWARSNKPQKNSCLVAVLARADSVTVTDAVAVPGVSVSVKVIALWATFSRGPGTPFCASYRIKAGGTLLWFFSATICSS